MYAYGALKQVLVVNKAYHYRRCILMACFYRWDKVDVAFKTYIADSITINTNELPPQPYTELRKINYMILVYS
jgi:hypothetical protein